ncbi:hypothetical protein [Phosphitispora sp. TUW77]|uniref:hypothetical protein n=1 Tax=Phosphitispora sp. TUW77 TaxID=3152361 RepID=UPI003AB5BD4B
MLRRKGIYVGIAVIVLMCFASAYSIYSKNGYRPGTTASKNTGEVRPAIGKDTMIFEEIRYACGDKVTSRIPTTSDLIGMEFAELVSEYPSEEGWSIDDTKENTLILARAEQRVCLYHRDYRHLGTSDGFLAVYEGPLGCNYKVLLREDIMVENLPPELQNELAMTTDYDNQTQDTQGLLKSLYEYDTEEELNMALENFDEFKQ